MQIVDRLQKKVPSNNLIMAGGCAMNGLVNGKILRKVDLKITLYNQHQQMTELL